ncbi:MAG: hypothetical protein WC010_03435 [Candidatus Absconditabacterales bacterium]
MADTKNPVIPVAQDLQINLEEAPKTEIQPSTGDLPPETNLDLDLNLSDAPKDDDRLKTEDQKNVEPVVETPTEVIASANEAIQNQETIAEMPIAAEPTLLETTPVEPVVEVPEEIKPEKIVIPEPVAEIQPATGNLESVTEINTPSTTIESEPITAAAPVELQEDMKIIDELEGHESAGGLAPEAVVTPQPTVVETPKTFDLDAMFGTPAGSPLVKGENERGFAFTIPTITTQTPVQAVIQTNIPQDKKKGIKMLLFVVMFMGLGFTTFFILKTMYPIELGNILGNKNAQIHAIDNTTGTVEEIVNTTEELSGIIETGTGTHESAPVEVIDDTFGALSDLGATTSEPEQNDVSRLTDYVTQGDYFLEQGKTMGNNTIIKYGLYITKKATTFLEKIANGEEINNLNGYFAQFDQYIIQLKELTGETTTSDTTGSVSTTTPTNEIQGMNDTTQDTGTTSN